MKYQLIQLLIILSFSAVSGQGIIEIDIPGLLKTERSPVLSEIASDIQFIKLQTTPDCLIQSVASVARRRFENDFCGGPQFHITIRISMNELACAYQITDLKDYVSKGWIDSKKAKNPVRYKELTDMINQSAAEDNPILVIAKLK